MKLELKYLKNYLGTGLKCKLKFDGKQDLPWYYEKDEDDLFELEGMMLDWYGNAILEIKPILLPLSALAEPMEDGSVPIMELAKINGFTPQNYSIELQNDTIVLYGEQFSHPEERLTARFFFELDVDNCNMDKGIEFKDNAVESIFSPLREQLKSFEYLFANHFDVYGLIPSGLAIDKRTIKP